MRRYDLDWLRVIVFGLLIFYHIGMFFVPWDWHIKNNKLYPWLEIPMIFINQWRLPILFVISGMGTSYALAKRTGLQFIKERLKRLLIPLIFGILIIVPPQIYLERISKGQFSGSYLLFLRTMWNTGLYPHGNLSWHHLWFLPYLLCFSLLLTPIFIYLRSHRNNILVNYSKLVLRKSTGFFLFVFPLLLAEIFLKPQFPQTFFFINDWFTIGYNLLLFFYGFLFISVGEVFWKTVQRDRRKLLALAIISFTILLCVKIQMPNTVVIEPFISVINTGSWMLTLFGYASKYLNKSRQSLSYANRAVYPFYILHQTIIVVVAYFFQNLEWNLFTKFTLMVILTFGITFFIYDRIILKIEIIQPLFGIKGKARKEKKLKEIFSYLRNY
ncbi:glucan biosynthesis protein [Christiangramia fulva]|uniref:Glucan biosynthesis protein n=1 Tax=Christiangramia fulva TaxID=2126553 RepID=A0A2R3Z2W9_9FLAO|nr:acyltransferase family protein [Christiangramia fulva]AVR44588.1 glucan biosynthesis protein [Christiangramia fulva]